MNFEALLFDLDGTLINFDWNRFVKEYLASASKFFEDLIPDKEKFYKQLLKSTQFMEKNDDGSTTTLEDFYIDFCPNFEVDSEKIKERFYQFYKTGFDEIEPLISRVKGAELLLKELKQEFPDVKIILATHPIYPEIVIKRRMEWGGISEEFFDHITHGENSYYCKENKNYWMEISRKFDFQPEKSLVIGNDISKDMIAKKFGFRTFLVETTIENEDKMTVDIEPDFRGTLDDFKNLLFSKT
jgi:FMN phosphatase YigB (HAD superfamily)